MILIVTGAIRRVFDAGLQWFIHRPLDFVLRKTTRGVAIVLPLAVSIVLIANSVGLVAFGHVRFEFFPSIQSESVTARVEMNEGTPFALTETVANAIGGCRAEWPVRKSRRNIRNSRCPPSTASIS